MLEELQVMKRTRIALVVDGITSEYIDLLIEGVRECGRKMGVDVFIYEIGMLRNENSNYEYQSVAITAFISENNIDGLLFVSALQTHYMDFEDFVSYMKSYYPIPMVNIAGVIQGVPSVVSSYEEAYKALLEHVVGDIGVKKIGLMTVETSTEDVITRERIVKEVLTEHNIDYYSIQKWHANFTYSGAMYELTDFAAKNPDYEFDFDAIIALNDEMALACIDFLKGRGKKIPSDILVTGFDDMKKSAFNNPPLSTVNQRVFEQGYVSARTLCDILLGKKVPDVQTIECKAILRQSTRATNYINLIKNNEYIEIDRATLAGTDMNFTASEWYTRRTQVYRIAKCYMGIQSVITEEEMVNYLLYNLKALGIPYISVVVYNKTIEMSGAFDYFHLPKSAYVLFSYNTRSGVIIDSTSQKISFNPNECILLDNLLDFNKNPLIVLALYNGKNQYGYMIIEKTNFDNAVYKLLSQTVSSMISVVYQNRQTDKMLKQLQDKIDGMDNVNQMDELTGVFNRRGLFTLGQKSLNLAMSRNQTGLVVYCDMDNLKAINDNFGHSEGDKAIIAEAAILRETFRVNDVVARVNGDEFVAICPGLTPLNYVNVLKRVESISSEYTENNNLLYEVSISMGYAEYPLDGNDYDLNALLSVANADMYEEKRKRKAKNSSSSPSECK